ncbi:MAG: P44/Msp2 family outer membrane protein [Anaplasma sp.]
MNFGKLLAGGFSAAALCACSFLISGSSVAASADHDLASDGGVLGGSFYIAGSYSPAFSSISSFDVREAGRASSYVFGYSKDVDSLDVGIPRHFDAPRHQFKFAKNLLTSFDGAVGYSIGGARVELETSYRKFATVAEGDYKYTGAHELVAISREAALTGQNYFTLRVDSITNLSVMLNGCYDVVHPDLPVAPYVCAGMGASFVDLAKHYTTKLAYRGKVGISYQLTPDIALTAGGYYHGIFDESFDNIPATNKVNFPGDAKASVKAHVADYGFNLGARFFFN